MTHQFQQHVVTVMKRRQWLSGTLVSGLVLCLALAGCVVAPDQHYYADGVVMVAPPAPRVEVYGEPPTPGYVWIGGYWNWVGGRHVWVDGHWSAPRSGYHWVAHQWVRQGDGWRMRPGRWERG